MFKDLRDTNKMAKEIGRNAPPVKDRLADMNQKMAALTESLNTSAAVAAPGGGVPAEVQIVEVGTGAGQINGDPILTVSVMVFMASAPPFPATRSLVVPLVHMHRMVPGTRLNAMVDPTDMTSFAFVW